MQLVALVDPIVLFTHYIRSLWVGVKMQLIQMNVYQNGEEFNFL